MLRITSIALVVVALGVVAFAIEPIADDTAALLFERFTMQHGKSYDSIAEREYRFEIFKSNMERIRQHNAETAAGKHSFMVAMNKFGDLTTEEFVATYTGLSKSRSLHPAPGGMFEATAVDAYFAPASMDWRKKGAVTGVKDQGQCGSCWAFSAVGAMEGAHFQATGKLLSLSEQLCVDCVLGGADDCNTGGEMHDCYLQIIKEGGEESEKAYPYEGTSGHKCRFDKSKSVATFSSYKNVTEGDEQALAVASSKYVISVGIDASQWSFQFYSSGVYDEPACKNGWNDLDHGVTLVGYGTLSGKDYWIVKNSWGNSWGLEGYILMTRGSNNQCGIATDATFPIV